ncbi:hypothetical protein F383_25672 [Gossypium arboreum]|uniref:Uncharacterized protein n=1 Tax=Gossypium arboreum TaxID=29729 RepID=A0A0B0MPK6_GOSAR|nr:hypothetical protein F383_25672 [Gossypium arboreum]
MILNIDEWLYELSMRYSRMYRQSFDVRKAPYEPSE